MSNESQPASEQDKNLDFTSNNSAQEQSLGNVPEHYAAPLKKGETFGTVGSLENLFKKIEVDFSDKTPEEKAETLVQLSGRLSDLNQDTNLRIQTGGQMARVKKQQELSELISRFILINTPKPKNGETN